MKALIKTVDRSCAEGNIKNAYEIFDKRGIEMPDPLKLISASPGFFDYMMIRNQYYANHPNLDPTLLAHIRFFTSMRLDYSFCKMFNKSLLEKMGMTKEDFAVMGDDPKKSMLEDKDKEMLLFVLRAIEDPEGIDEEDIESLREMGWEDSDMLDALAQGVGMHDHNIFMRTFVK